MEKIQKALEKARSARTEAQATGVQSPLHLSPTQRVTQTPAATGSAWSALPSLQLDTAGLMEKHVVTLEENHAAKPFDVMRTKILQTMRDNGWRRLAITSPTPQCGKSTISLNLAFSFSRQSETRMVLCEMDLRRPSIGKILETTPQIGIQDVLRGKTPFAEQAQVFNGNLALSLASRPVQGASELFQSKSVGVALDEIEAQYSPDLMIFDMPPTLVNDDMMAFVPHIDCVLIIAGAESTTVKQVDLCERELASQTNVMGVVLNKCRFMEDAQGYYAYGSY